MYNPNCTNKSNQQGQGPNFLSPKENYNSGTRFWYLLEKAEMQVTTSYL